MLKRTEPSQRKQSLGISNTIASSNYLSSIHNSVSESDEAERVVENPTYGVNDTQRQNTYEGVEQYSRTGPDYEPIERDPIEENYTSLQEATVPHIEYYASDID